MPNKISIILGAVVSVLIAQMAGVIGSFFTTSSIQSWYIFLEKPAFAPPNWLFAPAWLTLYTLMGLAAFLIWREYSKLTLSAVEGLVSQRKRQIKVALGLYGGQLALNALWSVIFFGMRNPGLAFLEILVLWALIVVVTVKFFKIDKAAGYLFIPYILWVTFAAALNFAVWQLNF